MGYWYWPDWNCYRCCLIWVVRRTVVDGSVVACFLAFLWLIACKNFGSRSILYVHFAHIPRRILRDSPVTFSSFRFVLTWSVLTSVRKRSFMLFDVFNKGNIMVCVNFDSWIIFEILEFRVPCIWVYGSPLGSIFVHTFHSGSYPCVLHSFGLCESVFWFS